MKTIMNNKSIMKNSVYNVLYKLFNVIYPLIVASYLARTLLPEGVGRVSYAQNIVTYFTYIAALGLPTYGTREIAKCADDQAKSSKTFTELFLINFISTTVCVISYYTMITTVPFFANDRILYYITGILIILNYLNVDWFYQGREEFRYIAIRSILVKVLSIIAVFLFVKDKNDYVIYAFIHCAIFAGNYFCNMWGLRKRVTLSFEKIDLKKHLSPLLILLCSSIAIELYTLLDTTMVGIWCDNDIVAYYSYAMKISKIIITVIAAISAVLLPRLSYYAHNKLTVQFERLISQGITVFSLISFPCVAGLWMVSGNLIPVIFGNAFMPAVPTSRILALLIVPITFSTFFGAQVLCSCGREKNMLVAVCSGAAINVVLNTLLIRTYAQNGAAIASVISETVVMLIDLYFVLKFVKIKIDKRDLFKILIALVCMVILVLVIYKIDISSNVLRLILATTVGAIVYFGTLVLLKEKFVFAMIKKVKEKYKKEA